ncbi:MAG: N5-carboxyaminoimidazole ribonucleotide mutase [Planctomycetota bacterium]|nr:MAG: N5-carboxyaminoimidazole ribonucleotide mutase [Planctomycetota bacterium]
MSPADSPQVGIVLGSDSDFDAMGGALEVLRRFGVPHEMTVASAHRSPARAAAYAQAAAGRGLRVLIAAASGAAHLAGTLAAHTTLPVIGVPLATAPLSGFDALLATVQMPPGVPVATVAVGSWGAHNAALLAVQILALGEPALARALSEYKQELARGVESKDAALQQRLAVAVQQSAAG